MSFSSTIAAQNVSSHVPYFGHFLSRLEESMALRVRGGLVRNLEADPGKRAAHGAIGAVMVTRRCQDWLERGRFSFLHSLTRVVGCVCFAFTSIV